MNKAKFKIWDKVYYESYWSVSEFIVACRVEDEYGDIRYSDWPDIWEVFWSKLHHEDNLYEDKETLKKELIEKLQKEIEDIKNY